MMTFTTSAAPQFPAATLRMESGGCSPHTNWWFVLSLLLLTGCRAPTIQTASSERVQRARPLLGTYVTISVYSSDRRSANRAINAAFDEFRRVDALMSLHRADSELSRLNSRAATEPVAVSPELFHVM